MSNDEILELAKYASDTLQPVIDSLNDGKPQCRMYLGLEFGGGWPGVSVWVHHEGIDNEDPMGILDYAVHDVTRETIDGLAARLPRKWEAALKADA